MREISELVKDLTASEPVVCIRLSSDGSSIRGFEPVEEIDLKKDTALEKLVARKYSQYFDFSTLEFKVDKQNLEQSVMNSIRDSIRQFIEKNVGMRNPRQSKLYRWAYRNMPRNHDFNDTLVMVYKYMCSFCTDNMVSLNQEHTKNTLALLEAIMEKYNEE